MIEKEVLDHLNNLPIKTMMEALKMNFTHFDGESLTAEMPVNSSVHQPYGLLHGGASAALAETLGSSLSAVVVKEEGNGAVGTNLNIYHLSSVKSGKVIARANFIRKGRSLHVVNIDITDEEGKAISKAILTNKIISLK